MNIILIGMRASGKTTIGVLLSHALKKQLIETDELVEKEAHMTIANLIRQNGWEHFRNLESQIIQRVSIKDNCIIATGGGVVTQQKNIEALRRNGFVICLQADVQTLVSRMVSDKTRPPLTRHTSKREEIVEVMKERELLYKEASDITIKTNGKTPKEVVEYIVKKII